MPVSVLRCHTERHPGEGQAAAMHGTTPAVLASGVLSFIALRQLDS